MVPAVPDGTYGLPGIYGVHCDLRNIAKFTTVDAFREGDFLYVFDEKITSLQQMTDLLNGNHFKKADLKSHNDYAYTFPFHESNGGKSCYLIKPEFDDDLSEYGLEGDPGYWASVDDNNAQLKLMGKTVIEVRKTSFAIIGDGTPQTIAVMGISVNPANLLAAVGSTTQLTATVTPANATSQAYTWSTSNASVATVSNSGLVTLVTPGTAYIYAVIIDETNNRVFTDSCLVTVKDQGAIANPDPIRNSQGNFNVSLSISSEGTFTATFDVTLPPKFTLNVDATKLAEDLAGYTLKITDRGNGVWSFEIAPNGLRSASTTSFREVVNVAYIVEKTLEDGDYTLKINDVTLTFHDGTVIRDDEIVIPVHFDSATGNETMGEAANVIYYGGVLSVNTPTSERIEIYSVSGALLFDVQKPQGAATYSLSHLSKGVLIVRGSNGWVKKIVK
jgi:hypothetical protein